MTTATHNLDWFETFYGGLKSLQHRKLVFNQAPEVKQRFLGAIMPTIISLGREPYNCTTVCHPGLSCRAYIVNKLIRAFVNGLKICLLAQLIPAIIRGRKQLFTKDVKKSLKNTVKILKGYFRASLFICLGTGLPFVL